MGFLKKTWIDRLTEYPTRRTLTKEDNTTEIVTVARNEGTVSQEGDAFSAANMNDLEQRVDDGFTEVNQSLNVDSDTFYFDKKDGKYGFNTDPNRGADTFAPFKSDPIKIDTIDTSAGKLSTVTKSYDFSSYYGYQNFSYGEEIYLKVVTPYTTTLSNGDSAYFFTPSYDQSTGILTLQYRANTGGNVSRGMIADLMLLV